MAKDSIMALNLMSFAAGTLKQIVGKLSRYSPISKETNLKLEIYLSLMSCS